MSRRPGSQQPNRALLAIRVHKRVPGTIIPAVGMRGRELVLAKPPMGKLIRVVVLMGKRGALLIPGILPPVVMMSAKIVPVFINGLGWVMRM